MQPLPQEQVQKAAQILLTFLDSEGATVPGNLLEGVVSGKSLLRGFLQGTLIVCQAGAPAAPVAPAPADPLADPLADLPVDDPEQAPRVIKTTTRKKAGPKNSAKNKT